MPPRPIVNDALWRCLCPRFQLEGTALHIGIPRFAFRSAASHRTSTPQQCQSRKSLATNSSRPNDPFLPTNRATETPNKLRQHNSRHSRNSKEKPSLVHLATPQLYELLRTAGAKGHHEEARRIISVLIKDRRERPNKEMYASILHSFVNCHEGTAGKVRKILEEMGFWDDNGAGVRVELDARGCECVLEALAVHPDYLLRTEILAYMKARWFTVSDRAQNFIVAGLLRDRCLEQALEKLEDMIKNRIRVEGWLWDKAMWMLLEFGEVEEAFFVLSLRDSVEDKDGGVTFTISSSLWGALLDAAAQKRLPEATGMVWKRQVQPGYLKPPTGTCLSTLALASRQGDVPLATDVFRVLTERDTVFNTHHYELLISTYLKANDLSAALSAILIMADAGLKVDAGTCHPLYWHLRNEKTGDASLPMTAFHMLQEFSVGRKVPVAALNACIQASISLSRLSEAIEIYKALHLVVPSGPNTQTFNLLFQGCSKTGRKDLAMRLVAEMIERGLSPDRLTYDRLILVCMQAEDVNDALLYYEEMRNMDMWPRRGTYEMLIYKAVERGDERAVAVLSDYRESGEQVSKGVERAVKDKFEVVGHEGDGGVDVGRVSFADARKSGSTVL